MKKVLVGFIAFTVCLCIGIIVVLESWDGENFVAYENIETTDRDPASVAKKGLHMNLFEVAPLSLSPERALLSASLMSEKSKGRIGINLGHFAVAEQGTGKNLPACQLYDKVLVTYVSGKADGHAAYHKYPTMELTGSCVTLEGQPNRMATLWVPVQQILALKDVKDQEIEFHQDGEVSVTFSNLTSELSKWPLQWNLRNVRFLDSKNKQPEIKLTAPEYSKQKVREMGMDWSQI